MSLLIPLKEESAHWYHANGAAAYDMDLRAVRKSPTPIYPSVTNILSAWPNPGLQRWKTEQIVLSSMTLPDLPGESTDARAARVIRDSEEQGKKAKEFGTAIHDIAERIAKLQLSPNAVPPKLQPWVEPITQWFSTNIEEVIWTEQTLVHPGLGYAGRGDLKPRLKGVPGKGILDIKTQEVPMSKAKVPVKKPNWYETWIMQLAAYQQADPDGDVDWVASLVIDSKVASPPYLYVWTMEETVEAWRDFLACFNAWKRVKRYEPIQPVKAEQEVACVG